MKPKYMLTKFRNLNGYYVIKRISGGYISGGMTITNYEIIYPPGLNLDRDIQRHVRFHIKGNGSSVKGTIFKKEKFHDSLRGIFKDLFEK